MPECQKIKNGGLDQYGPERFGRLILLQSEKCGTERVKGCICACIFVFVYVPCYCLHGIIKHDDDDDDDDLSAHHL